MKLNKYVSLTLAAALAVSGAYADDFDFGDDFGFGGVGESGSSSPVEISGSVDGTARAYITGDDEAAELPMDGDVTAKLDVKYSGTNADAEIKLKLDAKTVKDNPERILDEAYATAYLGNFKLEAGQMKNVWGKGDKLHVIDNFNADDYSDFIFPDYIDRRVATPMLKGSYAFDFAGNVLSNIKLEGVYTPFLPVDQFATSGCWTPAQVSGLTSTVTTGATDYVAAAFKDYTAAETEMGAIIGALSTLSAEATAAKTANDLATAGLKQATDALANVNLVHETVYKKLYDGAYAQAYAASKNETFSATQAKAYAEQNQEAQYKAYMKGLNAAYDSTYAKDVEKANTAIATAKDAVAATTYDFQEANGAYTEALKKYNYKDVDDAKEQLEGDLTAKATKYMYALTAASELSADPSIIYPNTNQFKYGQAGARVTASLGYVDLGLSYYYGHYKQPSVNYDKIEPYINKYLSKEDITEEDKFLAYDQKQTFGLEAATILWHFNVRGEACYNLTEDVDGTDPWVHNNSIQWLAGFDIDLPIWNMNVNVQETGTYILGNDKITDSATELFDVDYNVNGYSNNKIVANITTSFKNDQILPELTVMYGIENGDLVVMPKIVVKPTSELALTASGMYLWNKDDNSEFAGWNKNNFVQLGACLSF